MAGLVLEQLTRNVFARGTCSRWHLAVVLPVTAGCMCIKSCRCGMRNPGGRNQPCGFACGQRKIELFVPLWRYSLSLSLSLSLPCRRSLPIFRSCLPLFTNWRRSWRIRAFVNQPFGFSRSSVSASDFIAFKRASAHRAASDVDPEDKFPSSEARGGSVRFILHWGHKVDFRTSKRKPGRGWPCGDY